MGGELRIEDRDGVRTVTWDRPAALNALSLELWDGTRDALATAAADGVRCIVLTGTGRAFTVGQDLSEMTDPRHADPSRGFRGLMEAIQGLDVPLVAAVNGLAVGFGTTLLPWCDAVVAARSARFRVPFVSLGVTTEAAGSVALAAVMGPQRAARFVLTGEWLSAEQAAEAGLVGEVVDDDRLLVAAHQLAATVAAQPPEALRTTVRLLHAGRAEAWAAALEREYAEFARLAGGPENLAAIEAFFARR